MMFKILLLAASATAGFSIPLKENSPSTFHTGGKIVGGTAAEAGEIPWQVVILSQAGGLYCGGAIISPDWIVTAAHCSGTSSLNYRVRSGSLRYNSGGTTHISIQKIIHEDYDISPHENDIAVWKVSPPFTFDANTAPVALPDQGTESFPGTLMTVSGWGDTSIDSLLQYLGSLSDVLLKVDVPIVDKTTCDVNYGGIPPNQICAGYTQGGKDACSGDAGGPLFLDGVLYGIVSWGRQCALPDLPGVYVEVSAYRDWITEKTGI